MRRDDETDQQISAAFRRAAGLPAPEEIRQGREKLALTQKQLANLLGVGEGTVSRWGTGARIQQRAMDRFLRVCRASPAAVELLRAISRRARRAWLISKCLAVRRVVWAPGAIAGRRFEPPGARSRQTRATGGSGE